MKNNFIRTFIISTFFFTNVVFSESFVLESKNIEILNEGNQINAYEGKATSNDRNLEIKSNEFRYFKNLDTLKSIGNGELLIKSKKIKIKYDNGFFDQKKLSFTANGNVEIFQTDGIFVIKTDKIFFDQKNNIVLSDETAKVEDNLGNIYFTDSFKYEVNKDLLKVKNLVSKDSLNNTLKTSVAYINTKSGKIFGKDIKIDLGSQSSQNDNDYRLRGNSGEIDENFSNITKGIFTTCKKRDGCPPWTFSAKKITHDKKKREIVYDDAVLKVYDVPLAYFPKFFHPDPTVKRRSGFLIPSITNSSNSDNFLNIPFFYAIADNKDITFSPRLYADEKILIQSEFREKNFKSNHTADFSFFAEKDKNSKSHFFYEFDESLLVKNFDTSDINLKLQATSNDTYLKSNKIESEIVNDNNTIENSLNLDLYSNNLSINFGTAVYEDLNEKNNDRYEYVFPRLLVTKNFNNFDYLNGNLLFESDNLIRQYNTNVIEKQNVNDLVFNSNSKINRFGILNSYEFLVRNTNSENKNTEYKNSKNFYMSSIYQHNSALPLMKENNFYQKILKPKISLRAAPRHTKDEKNEERKVDITNIYSLDRASDGTSIEGGLSLTYGIDYSILEKLKTKEIFNLKLANNLRLKDNDDLTSMNQIGEKTSNVFSEIMYSPNDNLTTKYVTAIKNNLNELSYENLITEFKINKLVTTFDYLNENNTVDKSSYLSNTTAYNIDEFNSFSFATRKNKTKDLTEYYNMMYQYKNDCLAASIEYKKDFYSDRELKPDESIMLKLTITPFAEVSSSNIK